MSEETGETRVLWSFAGEADTYPYAPRTRLPFSRSSPFGPT